MSVYICVYVRMYLRMYLSTCVYMHIFTQPIHHGQDVMQGQFLSEAKLVGI